MSQEKIRAIVKDICDPDIYDFGFAVLRGLLDKDFSGYDFGISLIRKLDDRIIDRLNEGPTKEYFNYYNEINNELDNKVNDIESSLKNSGIDALGITATLTDFELDRNGNNLLRAKVSHKMTATRSGLGWIGKTGLLISSRFGPRARLASVLINEPVEPDHQPIDVSLCGNCNVCVDACPVGASKGLLWNKDMEREEFLDILKCREKCLELSKSRINEDISLCGICLSLCPKGKKS
jgi:epoxyqueuosine reductase